MNEQVKKKPGRPKVVNKKEIVGTALEPDLIDWVQTECEKLGLSRSFFIRRLLIVEREKKKA